jgi:hypothetical protein
MPNRLLRDGICTSDSINLLDLDEEILFYRLLVVADDFGFMDARPVIIKAQCFPLRETATPPLIERWLCGLAAKGLIERYRGPDGKPYLAINKWEQRQRSRPKYVGPGADGCQTLDGQDADNCQTAVALGKGKGKGKGATSQQSRELLSLPEGWKPSEQCVGNLSREFGLVPEDVDRYVAAFHDACRAKGYRYKDFDAAFRNCVRQDWPKYRNGRRQDVDYTAGAR